MELHRAKGLCGPGERMFTQAMCTGWAEGRSHPGRASPSSCYAKAPSPPRTQELRTLFTDANGGCRTPVSVPSLSAACSGQPGGLEEMYWTCIHSSLGLTFRLLFGPNTPSTCTDNLYAWSPGRSSAFGHVQGCTAQRVSTAVATKQ